MTIITILSIATALLVVTSTSTVYSVLWLVSTFLIISALLGLLNLGFTALLYIIVYVGAIAILFLFVVQLLDLGSVSEQPVIQDHKLLTSTKSMNPLSYNSPALIIISISLLTVIVIQYNMLNNDAVINTSNLELSSTYIHDIKSLLGLSDISANYISTNTLINISTDLAPVQGSTPQVQSIAEWFYGPGLLPLIVISIILLVAMIAPISLCKDND